MAFSMDAIGYPVDSISTRSSFLVYDFCSIFGSFSYHIAHILGYEQIAVINTEEKVKGDLMDLLKLTFYGQTYEVSPNGKIDCAIHLGNNIQDPVGVIFEVKMPGNVSEMITRVCN